MQAAELFLDILQRNKYYLKPSEIRELILLEKKYPIENMFPEL